MVAVDTVEGFIDDSLWFHYDVGNDVLYVVVASERQTPTVVEETPEGLIVERRQGAEDIVGITVISWWKRFGSGPLPDSLKALQTSIAETAKQMPLAA
jgi:hypothetical protein